MNIIVIKLLNKLKLLKFVNIEFKKKINNNYLRIPLLGSIGLENIYISELWMIDVLEKIEFERSETFVDVGINMGQTLLKFKSLNTQTNYVGFEPNPLCFFYAKKVLELNEFSNVEMFPVGIMHQPDILSLYHYSESDYDSAASVIENFRPGETIHKKTFVPVFNLENESISLSFSSRIKLLKIDVEGAELDVLLAFEKNIKIDRPFILIEILPCYNNERQDRITKQNKIEDFFRIINYSILRINKNSLSIESYQEIDKIGIHSNLNWCDYLVVPNEQKSKYLN